MSAVGEAGTTLGYGPDDAAPRARTRLARRLPPAAEGLRSVLAAITRPASSACIETGDPGEGGDRTLVIDAEAEDARLRRARPRCTTTARASPRSREERGTVDFGDAGVLVVVDPIDGSLNAKRGLPHHALSIAVADGPTMADVVFGFVYDFGPGEEWRATRGEGRLPQRRARSTTRRPSAARPTGASSCSASSRPTRAGSRRPPTTSSPRTRRIRAIGSIAVSLCQVAADAGRRDGDAGALPRGRRRGRAS